MYEIFSKKRISGFWSKTFQSESWFPAARKNKVSIDYSFDSSMPYYQSTNTVGLSFIQDTVEKEIGKRSTHPVASVTFTEEQLVEFIIEAEKALRSIQGKV